MKKLILWTLLFSLSPAWAQGTLRNSSRFIYGTDIPITVGIQPDLPFVTPGGKLGHWGVGNGGDWLRIGFARARDYAANVVLRIKPSSLSRIQNAEIRQWIIANQKFLAADILQTEHVWVQEEKPSCAFTVPPGADGKIPTSNPIQFSYPTCRESALSFLQAAQILIHESTHHFNADETTADLIAIGIIDAWQSGMMDSVSLGMVNAPSGTQMHTAQWTGDTMIIVGGTADNTLSQMNTATSYDPRTGVWTDLASPAWFQQRVQAASVWTGEEIFIWGGFKTSSQNTTWLFDGALYNPKTKVWKPVAKPEGWYPKAQISITDPWQTVMWTGDKAIVYGGVDVNNMPLGAIYDPATSSWTLISPSNPNDPEKKIVAPIVTHGHAAAWTGSSMIVWGGYNLAGKVTATGAIYNPTTKIWKAMDTRGTPTARAGHQAIWTGERFVVVSGGGIGTAVEVTSTGGLYDPQTDAWTSYRSELMVERLGHKAIWNGEEILVIGGQTKRLMSYFGEVYAFNPATLRWRILAGSAAPPARSFSSIVWTGSSALVWGGYSGSSKTQRSGAMYFP